MPSMVFAGDQLEMAGRPSRVEARSRPASRLPCIAIGLRPEIQRKRADLPFTGQTSCN